MIPLDSASITFYSLVIIIVILLIWVVRLEFKIRGLLGGTNASNLEKALKNIHREMADTDSFKKEATAIIADIDNRLSHSVRAVKTVRFNPFKGSGSGGNQSFATAFINEKGIGVILSSLYSRERSSIFSKPVNNFQSEFELTAEEKQVLTEARTHLSQRN